MTLGERLQAARKAAGFSQRQLATICGVAMVTIGQYERGKRQPRLEQLQAIAAALGVSINDLLSQEQQIGKAAAEHSSIDEGKEMLAKLAATTETERKAALDTAFDKLNNTGQEKAVERVEELTEIPKYTK